MANDAHIDQSPDDPRVPHDRTTLPANGAYYRHQTKANCTKHGACIAECIHPARDSKLDELVIECLECRAESIKAEGI